jgi:ABC-type nitrate/sulfonate/bicarbonate transport system substrate-binding protein
MTAFIVPPSMSVWPRRALRFDAWRKGALAGLVALAAFGFGTSTAARALEKIKVVIPQNSVFVLSWEGGRDAGIFKKHGIDLEVDARPFAGYLAGLPSKEANASTYSGIDAILKMNQGMNLAVIGGGLTVFQEVFVRKDSPIKTIQDLRGKRFGVWSTGAGSFKAVRAVLMDAAGIDVTKDTKLVQMAAPALIKLLERGDVDAMLNISSFTIQAASQPDKFRSIFVPNEYWIKKTGYPIVWSAPLVAWKDWVDANPERARNFATAVEESFKWLKKPENLDTAVAKFGKLAGVTTPEQVATYKDWFGKNKVFLTKWDQKVIDAEWQFLELARSKGIIDAVPDKQKHAVPLETTHASR